MAIVSGCFFLCQRTADRIERHVMEKGRRQRPMFVVVSRRFVIRSTLTL